MQDGKLVLKTGKEEQMVTVRTYADTGSDVVTKKTKQEWIGTEIVVQQGAMSSDGKEKFLNIELTHDIAAPDSRPYQYATAAKGAERDKYTVPLPRFHRLHWKGELPPDQTERAIASFPSEENPGTRIVVFFHGDFGQKAPPYEITQTIYRVQELEMIELMLAKSADDAAIVEHLEKARVTGRASIVSEVSTFVGAKLTGSLQSGTEHHVPREMGPHYDLLYQLPVASEPVLEGTRLEFKPGEVTSPPRQTQDPKDPFFVRATPGPAPVQWHSWFGSSPPVVSWPTSWLSVYDQDYKPTGKAITGFMDWYDRVAQEITADFQFPDNSPRIVAMLSPADQVWGTKRQGRWLDVTVARCQNHTDPAPAIPAAETASPCLILGISLESRMALALLEKRGGNDDADLLSLLMQRVKQKTAQVRLCMAATSSPSNQILSSAREHAYPTEMPSIPSAWGEFHVGSSFECDGENFTLEQDLAPPSRMEWKLALDVPEAIMWQPSRRFLRTTSKLPRKSGTYLCSAVAVPGVLAAEDMPAGETLLLFVHQARNLDPAPVAPREPVIDVEALVFEIPATDADTWKAVKSPDFASFIAQKLDARSATLSGHALQRQRHGSETTLAVSEYQMTATEFDPPEPQTPGRMRPTAMEGLPVGTRLQMDFVNEGFGSGSLKVDLEQSIAKPIEPSLPETLKIAASGNEDYPGAKHLVSEWKEQLTQLQPNELRCLGVRRLPGNDKSVHIAYVRVRDAK